MCYVLIFYKKASPRDELLPPKKYLIISQQKTNNIKFNVNFPPTQSSTNINFDVFVWYKY